MWPKSDVTVNYINLKSALRVGLSWSFAFALALTSAVLFVGYLVSETDLYNKTMTVVNDLTGFEFNTQIIIIALVVLFFTIMVSILILLMMSIVLYNTVSRLHGGVRVGMGDKWNDFKYHMKHESGVNV